MGRPRVVRPACADTIAAQSGSTSHAPPAAFTTGAAHRVTVLAPISHTRPSHRSTAEVGRCVHLPRSPSLWCSPRAARRPGVEAESLVPAGGMIMGDVEGEDAISTMICDAVGAVVVFVEYRLAPEHPHPVAGEECYAGLVWTARNAAELGMDPDRLAIYGLSARAGASQSPLRCGPVSGAPRAVFPDADLPDDRRPKRNRVEPRDHRRRHLRPCR